MKVTCNCRPDMESSCGGFERRQLQNAKFSSLKEIKAKYQDFRCAYCSPSSSVLTGPEVTGERKVDR